MINDSFHDVQLLLVENLNLPWYADYVNYLASGILPPDLSYQQKKKFLHDIKSYFWDKPLLFKQYSDQMIRRCVPEEETEDILMHCHSSDYAGHFRRDKTASKVFKDAHFFVLRCDMCQRVGSISKKQEMPLQNILEVEIFYVWEIDFMGPFIPSNGQKYILLAVDYVSKWVEAVALLTNDANVVLQFLRKNILTRFDTPHAIVSDKGSHFCNKLFSALLQKYGVKHKITTAYHPQIN